MPTSTYPPFARDLIYVLFNINEEMTWSSFIHEPHLQLALAEHLLKNDGTSLL